MKEWYQHLRVPAYGESQWYVCELHIHGQKCNPMKLPAVFIGPFRLPFRSDCQNVKTGSKIEAKLAKHAWKTLLSHVYMYVRLKDNSS